MSYYSKPDPKALAMYIAAVVRSEMEDFHHQHLSNEQMKELNPIIRNAIYSALVAFQSMDDVPEAREFVDFYLQMIPHYWEEPRLTDELRRQLDSGTGHEGGYIGS